MPNPSQTYNITGGVHCADFIGGDKNITYGFSAEDVERLIEKMLTFRRAGDVFLPTPGQPDTLQIEHDDQKLVFQPGAAQQLAEQGSERAYLLALSIDQEYQCWATHFVPLAGIMDVRQIIKGLPISFTEFIIPMGTDGVRGQAAIRPLKNISEAMQTHRAFVILGEPGAGKTTTQQKIAFDLALARLESGGGRVPLFVRLSQQREHDPYSFLQTEWERRVGTPFARALADGRILILADGLNEIPREKRNERLKDWMLFEQQYRGANQLIFSGREKDYDNQLNLPRVLVEPLDEPRITEFLKRHDAEGLADLLADPANRLNEMARNPLNLFVLVMIYLQGGKNLQMLTNRGKLFQSFSLSLMAHEQLWHPDGLSVDSKVELFAHLAYDMQKQGSGTTFALEIAKQAMPAQVMELGEAAPVDASALLRFGRGASILDPATLPDVRFYHHLLQEYFAAHELLRRFNSGEDFSTLWRAKYSAEEMPPAYVGAWDSLTEPPTSDWEVTTILACGLSRAPETLIEAVCQANPILAGRCLEDLGEAGLGHSTVHNVIAALEVASLDRCLPPTTQRDAGFILGRLAGSSLAFLERIRPDLDEWISIPADKFRYGNEKRKKIIQTPFAIQKYPVTNLQYKRFVEDKGYDRSEFWSEEGWAWKMAMDWFLIKAKNIHPSFWHNKKWNNPLAPVVGVSWFEAEAYANWLSKQRCCIVRLPTEQEWERAARGVKGREYAWGNDFDRNKLNCAAFWQQDDNAYWSSEEASPTIVGQFPDGATPDGICDLSGNVWEWTTSWYDEEQRVLRGGAWINSEGVTCAYRNRITPDMFLNIVGFRTISCAPE